CATCPVPRKRCCPKPSSFCKGSTRCSSCRISSATCRTTRWRKHRCRKSRPQRRPPMPRSPMRRPWRGGKGQPPGRSRRADMHLVNRTFAELSVGETAELRRLVTPDDLYVFAAASGNYNPMHLPSADVDGDGRPENIAPGMFVASLISAVLGTLLPGPGTLYLR